MANLILEILKIQTYGVTEELRVVRGFRAIFFKLLGRGEPRPKFFSCELLMFVLQ